AGSFGLPAKHDRHNTRVLARFGRERQPHPWQPPASFSPHLHALLKRLEAVEQNLKRKLNRQEHAEAGQVPAAVHASLTRVITALE
ncbi:MAG TPA: hypothetical protein VEP67_13400, partial [Thiobacillaceae bacterium]|nr:hypothetical protein [Thiobacillaceae bacterium]